MNPIEFDRRHFFHLGDTGATDMQRIDRPQASPTPTESTSSSATPHLNIRTRRKLTLVDRLPSDPRVDPFLSASLQRERPKRIDALISVQTASRRGNGPVLPLFRRRSSLFEIVGFDVPQELGDQHIDRDRTINDPPPTIGQSTRRSNDRTECAKHRCRGGPDNGQHRAG